MRLFVLSPPYLNEDKMGYLGHILSNPRVRVVGAAIHEPLQRPAGPLRNLRKVTGRGVTKTVRRMLYNRIERRMHDSTKVTAVDYFESQGIPVLVTPRKYDNTVIEFIKSQAPDAMFRMAWGLIREPLLTLSPIGILSYHHGDLRKYRGMPACFWQYYNEESSMKVTVQILEKGIDCGPIVNEQEVAIYRGDTLKSLHRRAYAETYSLLAEACELLSDDRFIPLRLTRLRRVAGEISEL